MKASKVTELAKTFGQPILNTVVEVTCGSVCMMRTPLVFHSENASSKSAAPILVGKNFLHVLPAILSALRRPPWLHVDRRDLHPCVYRKIQSAGLFMHIGYGELQCLSVWLG